MISKERLLKHIHEFPEEFEMDELIDRLLFINKLENRIKMSKLDDTISEEELVKETREWSK